MKVGSISSTALLDARSFGSICPNGLSIVDQMENLFRLGRGEIRCSCRQNFLSASSELRLPRTQLRRRGTLVRPLVRAKWIGEQRREFRSAHGQKLCTKIPNRPA